MAMIEGWLRKGWFWIMVSMVLTLILNAILPYNSEFVEAYYSQGIFRGFRILWDYTLGFSPIPLIYLLLGFLLWYLLKPFFSERTRKRKFQRLINRLLLSVCCLVIAFYWMWAFNYKRIDIRQTLGLQQVSIDEEDVYQAYREVSDSLMSLRAALPDTLKWAAYEVDQPSLREELLVSYRALNLNDKGRVRIRKLYPKGSLLHISTAGVYLPFVGEGHIDPGLHPITHPFTMMHEMSHGYGWTGEDVCNFLALIGSINSKDPIIRYSGYMAYWRYLRSNAYRADRDRWKSVEPIVNAEVMRDYKEMIEYTDRYPDIMPKLRNLIYDNYLKSHGIKEGLVSYSEMIKLAHGWKEKHGSLILK
ncbi:MAG: hypothetical protein ACI9FN_000487 [Saprospiraceae bacterium]|jgi:hypothetical protein